MEGSTVNFTWKEAYHCWHSLLQLAHKMTSPGCAFYHQAWCLLPTKWLERVLHMLWADQHQTKKFPVLNGVNKHKMLSLVITNSDCYDFSQLIIFPKEIPETGHPDFLSPDKPTGPGGRNPVPYFSFQNMPSGFGGKCILMVIENTFEVTSFMNFST